MMRIWMSFLILLLLLATSAYAVPGFINYQGVLTDSVGTPLNQDVSVTFRLYDAATAGTAVWSEIQTVTVSNGVYSVQLGQSTSLAGVDFSVDYWLEVEVGGEILTPRQALTSVPYAIRAQYADGVAANTTIDLNVATESALEATVKGTNNGNGYGVYGWSLNNFGVYGYSSSATGIFGSSNSGTAIKGLNGATGNFGYLGGSAYSVYGFAASSGSYAGYFQGNTAITGNATIDGSVGIGTAANTAYGVHVRGDSMGGQFTAKNADPILEATGLFAQANGTAGENHYGIYGTASGANHNYGVYGSASGSTGELYAGYFQGNTAITGNATIDGVVGIGTAANTAYGVKVRGDSMGGQFTATNADPIREATGLFAQASGAAGENHYGIYGTASGANYNYGVYGSASGSTGELYAGYFAGRVRVRDDLIVENTLFVDGWGFFGGATFNGLVHAKSSLIVDGRIDFAEGHDALISLADSTKSIIIGGNPYLSIYPWSIWTKSRSFQAFVTNGVERMRINDDGTISVYGTISETSDIRLKENIYPLDSALYKIGQIEGVSFNWRDPDKYDDRTHLGVIAQQVEGVFPEVVFTSDDEMGTKSVDYNGLIAPLIEAVKELKGQSENLQAQNLTLENQNKALLELVCQDHPNAGICQ